ncbi:MAG: ribosome small subunit-dependent GTPase A [Anaerolineae bacterium]|nr:ribosome small subunit-dependent GTPase A [Anaerolineae bacterium]
MFEEKAQRAGGSAKKTPKAQKPAKVRQKNWTDVYAEDPDAYDDLDIESTQRVMPKGETEWREAKVIRSPLHEGIAAPGARPAEQTEGKTKAEPQGAGEGYEQSRGTVVEVATGLYTVDTPEGRYLCSMRKSLRIEHSGYSNMIAVGDHVVVSHNGHKQGIIDAILPRRSALARPDPFNEFKQQIIVANVDQLLIVAAWRSPAFWPELVDRYLIAALRNNLAPIIAINKVDLVEEPWDLEGVAQAYRLAGCRVILTSATTGRGLDELREALAGRTTALAGLSGVGKSSLLSAAEPGLNLKVGEVNEQKQFGRHTTTQSSLHPLKAGGFVVDTPGIREFGLAGLTQAELKQFYPEFAEPAKGCEYANCTHTREPWCGVKSAMRAGRLSRMRIENYWKIRDDLE